MSDVPSPTPTWSTLEPRSAHTPLDWDCPPTRSPAPVQVAQVWMLESTRSWLNDFGWLHCCTERAQFRRI